MSCKKLKVVPEVNVGFQRLLCMCDAISILMQVVCCGMSDYHVTPEFIGMLRCVNILYGIVEEHFDMWRFTPLSLIELKIAVLEYGYHQEKAIRRYGEISKWDISNVDSLFFLFSSFEKDNAKMVPIYFALMDLYSCCSVEYGKYKNKRPADQRLEFVDCLQRGDTLRRKCTCMVDVNIDFDYLRSLEIFDDIELDSMEVRDIVDIYSVFGLWMIPTKNVDFDISKWKTSHVKIWMGTFLQYDFTDCVKLRNGLERLKMDEAIKMNYMFWCGKGLCYINFSEWSFPKCRTMSYMLSDTDIRFIQYFQKWKIQEVKKVYGLFYGCNMLYGDMLPEWTDVHLRDELVLEFTDDEDEDDEEFVMEDLGVISMEDLEGIDEEELLLL